MKHYRILEKKGEQKQYIIQYLKKLFFGLYYWKKLDKTIYYKYDDALNGVKQVLVQEDYETSEYGYHYIDAYKMFKYKEGVKPFKSSFTPAQTTTKTTEQKENSVKKLNKSVFIKK
jgi:hypothetical protein